MEVINHLSPPAPAPESFPKLPSSAAAGFTLPKEDKQTQKSGVDVALSAEAQKKLEEKTPPSLAEQQKNAQEQIAKKVVKETPPPPLLGQVFYEFNQRQVEKNEAARLESLKEVEKRFNNYLQYTNNYLAQLAYAKTLADQPFILPQPAEPKDLADRLNLFA